MVRTEKEGGKRGEGGGERGDGEGMRKNEEDEV